MSLVRPEASDLLDEDPLHSRSDDDLMLLARAGHETAFDALVRRHQRNMLSVAARLVGRSTLAPDLAQNTFIAIFRALPQYQARGKFPAYLYRVLLNQCRLVHRSAHVENHALDELSRLHSEPGEVAEDVILARERQREVESALDSLSQKLRQVVVLRYSGGLSYDEIAEALTVPVGTVKRRLFDAMAKLRDSLEGA